MWFFGLLATAVGIEVSVPANVQPQLVTYYINTDAEVGRRHHMEEQARRAGLEMLRFKAVDRSRVDAGEFDRKYVKIQNLSKELLDPSRQKDHLANATVACYVSHSELLEKLHRELGHHQYGLVLEDDVEIPRNWEELINNTLACAPSDWSLLKVSGWGYSRRSDLQLKPGDMTNSTAIHFMSWLQSLGGWMSRTLFGAPAKRGVRRNVTRHQLIQLAAQEFPEERVHLLQQMERLLENTSEPINDENDDMNETCPDAYLMKRPFKETFWWHFWGPAFHYAGTGAYLVKASSIPGILSHLRRQPINDIDGMLLSEGNLRAYELWPHIFPLAADHMKSTMKDSRNYTAGLLDALATLLRDDSPIGYENASLPENEHRETPEKALIRHES